MTYRYIYKITCTKGSFKDKFYFGKHTTNNLDDGYKGSGKRLNDYYKKHPNDYIKEIISFHSSEEELNKAEYDIIHPWLNNIICLNDREGGEGGRMSNNVLKEISKKLKGRPNGAEKWMKDRPMKEEVKQKISNTMKNRPANNKGKSPSEETRKRMSITRKNRHAKWVTNGITNACVPETEIQKYLNNGYHFGRTNHKNIL